MRLLAFRKRLLPTIKTKGDPFYIIMEKNDNLTTTGTYYQKEEIIPLFISRLAAIQVKNNLPDTNRWDVYGVRKEQLGFLCGMRKIDNSYNLAFHLNLK